MKNLLLLLLSVLVISCGDDDSVNPTLNITTPSNTIIVDAGGEFAVSGVTMDDVELEKLTVTAPVLTLSVTITGAQLAAEMGIFTINLTVDEATPPDTYEILFTAIDLAGNSTEEIWTFTVL